MHITQTRNRWSVVFTSLLGALATAVPALGQATAPAGVDASAARRPNIVVIVSDDQGYADLGVQGCKDIPTPNIDSIGRNGVRFTNGYVSCPVCSPTRAGLMTGRYQQRFGHEVNPGPPGTVEDNFGLPLTETTIANRLKQLGYATGMFGKWHLGYKSEMHPLKRGFDEFFGFLAGAHTYLDVGDPVRGPILRGTEPVAKIDYLTDDLGREAVSFVERHHDRPFFVYLPFNAVHSPMQPPPGRYKEQLARLEGRRRDLAGMLMAMDDAVGMLLTKLRQLGVEEDTLIFYVSDNGGPTPGNASRNDPLRGTKGQVLEGGIRVPFLVQWKRGLPMGIVYDAPVISLDIVPTAVAAVGGDVPAEAKLDGVNLLPYLRGERKERPHEQLFWRYAKQAAVRVGDWKLLRQGDGAWELYNLAEDIGESKDLASEQPEKAKALQAAYDQWNSTLVPPLWEPRGGQRQAQPRAQRPQGRRAQQQGAGQRRARQQN